MKYVQHIRVKWRVRIKVPDELVQNIGKTELSESNLPPDPRSRERLARGIINRFPMQINEARKRLETQGNALELALAAAAQVPLCEHPCRR